MNKLKKWLPGLYIVGLTVLILGPLLQPGYVFFLDFVMAPEHKFDILDYTRGESSWSFLLFNAVEHFFTVILPASTVQKLTLFSVFLVIGLAMWRALPERIGLLPRLLATTFY